MRNDNPFYPDVRRFWALIGFSGVCIVGATRTSILWLQISCFIIGAAAFLIALKYFGGLPCKQRQHSTIVICSRCSGFYISTILLIICIVCYPLFGDKLPTGTGYGIIYLMIGVLFLLPTVIQGRRRRLKRSKGDESRLLLFLFGLLVGLAPFWIYIAWQAFAPEKRVL